MKKLIVLLIGFAFVGLVIMIAPDDRASAVKDRYYYEKTGEILWEIKTEEKVVALTFDDGPHPIYTAEILDLLEKYDAKATFFVVGENVEKYSETLLRQYNEGHEIANHTYTHPLKTTIGKLEKELKKTEDIIFSVIGMNTELFRPVEGQYTDGMIKKVVKNGYKVVMWSWHQDTEDWKSPGVQKIKDVVLEGVQPGNIVLFHDGGGDRSQTVEALQKILPELQKQGYEFVTVSELMKMGNIQ